MLRSIYIRRLRSVFEQTVDLAPLTVLVGPNGAGKSNILRAILVAALVSRGKLGWNDSVGPSPHGNPIERFDSDELYGYTRSNKVELKVVVDSPVASPPSGGTNLARSWRQLDQSWIDLQVSSSQPTWTEGELLQVVAGVRYISPNRVASDAMVHGLGETGDLSDGLVQSLERIATDEKWSESFLERGRSLFGLDWEPLLKNPREATLIDMAIGRGGVYVPLALGSLGTRQFLPILAQSMSMAMQGTGTLMLEEPEISLHPKAQVNIGEYFGSIAGSGAQFIITTHSHYLVLGICKMIRAGVLAPEDVAILNCRKTNYGTMAERLPLDEYGRIEGGIPSFVEVDNYLFQDWVKSLPGERR